MSDASIHVERAAASLVIALFLAAALLISYIFFQLVQDYKARTAPLEETTSQVIQLNPALPIDLMQPS